MASPQHKTQVHPHEAMALQTHAPLAKQLSFDACYDTYAPLVTRWVSRLGGPSMDLEDVVQEVFCVVLRRLPEWGGEGAITTWLFRITHHVVRNWNRKRRLYRWLGLADADDSILQVRSEEPGAVEQLESQQAANEVRRVLDLLPEKHRTLIVLFELEELSTPEIAEMLDVKVGTVRVGLHRARSEFVKTYEKLQQLSSASRGGRA